MAWYNGTFSCGHEGRVNIIGKMSERQWKIDKYFSGVCEECKKKEREEAWKKAQETAKEYEFPDLKGTEKQILWANEIRLDFYNRCLQKDVDPDEIIVNEMEAKFWIDNRDDLIRVNFIEAYRVKLQRRKVNEELVDMDTVKPADVKHEGVVEIVKKLDQIVLHYIKDNDFIALVKDYRYNWDGTAWCRKLSETTGRYEDRAAEIGNALLKAGFCICIHDKDITQKAIAGDFQKEHTRWIKSITGTNLLSIRWIGRNEELYKKARALKGSQYDSPSVVIDVSYYEALEKFAAENNFKFTEKAEEKIKNYIQQMDNAKTVEVK